jgi:hypothetical protein
MGTLRIWTDEEILAAFGSRGVTPEQCWICANAPIYRRPDGDNRPLMLDDRGLEDACVAYLRRIRRPETELKGE